MKHSYCWEAFWARLFRELALVVIVATVGLALVTVLPRLRVVYRSMQPTEFDLLLDDPTTTLSQRQTARVGKELHIGPTDWSIAELNILLVTSYRCPFCLTSSRFHRSLFATAHSKGIPFYIAVPDPRGHIEFLKQAGLDAATIVSWTDLSLQLPGTPSILLLDRNGSVGKMWVGALDRAGEDDVFNIVATPSSLQRPLPSKERSFLAGLRTREPRSVVVDLSDRKHLSALTLPCEFKNIPAAEIDLRAVFELSKQHLNILDCSLISFSECDRSYDSMVGQGFLAVKYHANWGDLREWLSCDR